MGNLTEIGGPPGGTERYVSPAGGTGQVASREPGKCEFLLGVCTETWVLRCFLRCLAEHLLRPGPVALVVVDRPQPDEQRRPVRTGRAGSERRFDQFLATGYLAAAKMVIGRVHRSFTGFPGAACRCQPRSLLLEDGRRGRRAPRSRVLRRAVDYLGDLFTRSLRAEGEMPGEVLDLLGNRPQLPVHVPAFIQGHLGIQH